MTNKEQNHPTCLDGVSGSAIEPPLGLIPKRFHDERVRAERFNEVCGAISRYYYAGLKINIEWIEEYNELVESVGNKDLRIDNVVGQGEQLVCKCGDSNMTWYGNDDDKQCFCFNCKKQAN